MNLSELIFVGSFWDQPSRILAYTTAARAVGASTRFINDLAEVNYRSMEAKQFIFTDEAAIMAGHETAKSDGDAQFLLEKTSALMRLTDKYSSRQITQDGFKHEHFLITQAEDVKNLTPLSGRWVCKPRWGSNSRDVREVSGLRELQTAADKILSRENNVILERHIDGDHLCIDFAWDGSELWVTGYCKKLMTDFEPKIIEAYHTLDPDLMTHAKNACGKLKPIFEREFGGISFSVHGEFIVEHATGDVKIAELNARAPWGLLPEFFSTGNGVDYDGNVIRNALGLPVSKPAGPYPAVLGSIYSKGFFHELHNLNSYGNTIYVDPLEVPYDEDAENKLVKYGRFLLWGESFDSIQREWKSLSQLALPDTMRRANQIDTSDTWKSRCC